MVFCYNKRMLGGKLRLSWTPVFILFSVFAVLGFFQNCTPAVPFGTTDYYQSLVNSSTFPYETKVDQLAYMSCSEQEDIPNDGTFFTFRMGAFRSGGIRITQNYRSNVNRVRNTDVPTALTQAQASAQTQLQMAIRTLDNLQLMYVDQDNGQDGVNGSDYNNFFPNMGDEDLNNILWYMEPTTDYLRTYAPAQFVSDYRFEGELKFMKSQIMENDLRTFFSGRGLITLTWAMPGEVTPLGQGSLLDLQALESQGQSGNVVGTDSGGVTGSSVASDNNSVHSASTDLSKDVFGVAVQPRFEQPLFLGVGNPGVDMPPRVLSSVNDVTIDSRQTGQLQRPWVCPDQMKFMIVLPEDATYQDDSSNTIVRCAMNPDPVNPSQELKIIRQSLYAEDFYVDMARHCVVPKPDHTIAGSCYGKDSNTQNTYLINYETWSTEGCGFNNDLGLCPHFASVCYRQ